ncbi:hypothetical protein [Haloarchaeobius sp. HRN-SO-5]|uniref:hypothetical protein n=1 Tax=Haloarchaeobius sp. HRN-SO-5 TaxID=3446118 RepID=UPI003EBE895C
MDEQVLKVHELDPREPFAWKIEDEALVTKSISYRTSEVVADGDRHDSHYSRQVLENRACEVLASLCNTGDGDVFDTMSCCDIGAGLSQKRRLSTGSKDFIEAAPAGTRTIAPEGSSTEFGEMYSDTAVYRLVALLV